MIPDSTVELIKDTARVEDVVSDYLTLKRSGSGFVACCPFHHEKTPSFHVTPSRGIYKCFGCGKGGSAISFVMEMEHCTYVDALRLLARKYGIEIVEKEESEQDKAERDRKESLMQVSEFAQKFFAQQLQSGTGRDIGYAYFKSRQLEDETINHFGLGWAPAGKTSLIDAATAAGYKTEYLVEAGLAVAREDGSLMDKFRERVMFPIHSVSGRVIAFSGRTLRSDNPAKYLNSPETPIYRKSNILLGIYFAKQEIARQHKCILVEGNVDMVMMHQLGIRNVVASCGTALTPEQVRLIKRIALDDITIMYDGDAAGIKAALKGINLVLREGLNVKIVLLPDGDDPDSFARKHTLEEVQAFISENEQDFIQFKSKLLADEAGSDPIKRAGLINDIADTIADIPDAVKRSVYVSDCASRFGIEQQLLFNRIKFTRSRQRDPSPATQPAVEVTVDRQPQARAVENKLLWPSEKELLSFLLEYGRDILAFPSDSELRYGDEDVTVADFIRTSLDEDGAVFENSILQRLYDEYFRLYDSGVQQNEIVRSILNSSDLEAADTASEICATRYELTVDNLKNSMTSRESWLVMYVPKAIIHYNGQRVQNRIKVLKKEMLLLSEAEQENAMKELISLQNVSKKLKELYDKKF